MSASLNGDLLDHFSAAFRTPSRSILAEYDTRTVEALSRLVSTLLAAVAQNLVAQWPNVLSGTEDAMRDQSTPSKRHARSMTSDNGDDEHPSNASK